MAPADLVAPADLADPVDLADLAVPADLAVEAPRPVVVVADPTDPRRVVADPVRGRSGGAADPPVI